MPKNDNLCLRIDSAQRAALEKAAAAAGQRVTTFAREVLFANIVKQTTGEASNDNTGERVFLQDEGQAAVA